MKFAPALLTPLAESPVGWLASEKFDGVRAIWTGSAFMSRSGRVLRVPEWFRAGMPDVRLDGELWAGRGGFETVKGQLQRKSGQDFSSIRYMAFETCDMVQPVEARIAALAGLPLPAHVEVVQHVRVRSATQLDAMEREIFAAGGEGVVIRRPGSLYRPGRFGDVVKVKRLHDDDDRWHG